MDTTITRTIDGVDYNRFGERVIVCEFCRSRRTTMLGTKRCDPCFDLQCAVLADPNLALKVLNGETNTAIANPSCLGDWQPIATAPRDGTPILGWCLHSADAYVLDEGRRLTVYGGIAEALSHVQDGPHVVVWGGAFDDGEEGPSPDWWFQHGSEFETVANPVFWTPISAPFGFDGKRRR